MEQFGLPYYYYGLWLCLALIVHVFLHAKLGAGKKIGLRMPPGPCQLPLIGSLHHLLSGLPHRAMRELSLRYGPLMLLRICEHVVVVVSSAEIAREIFKGHDTAFEQRPRSPGIDEVYSGHGLGVIFAPYGEHWRLLRRILVTELLSARRVEAFQRIRQDEAARLISSLASSPPGQLVNVDQLLAEFIADSSVSAIFGDRLPDRAAFLKMMKHGTDFSSLFDLRDLFPSSRLVRMLPRSHKKERHRQKLSQLFDDILQHHEERRAAGAKDGEHEQDMIDVLMRMRKEGAMQASLNPGVIKAVAIDVFGAALDTSTSTLQWAMAELIANPRVMEKAQLEIRRALAGQERVQEAALKDLYYLKAVVKETLRLHPPGPFIPRVCLDDQKVQGFDVPKGTIVVTNAWAISRDPKYWEDSDSFMPERFEGERPLDFRGLHFEFTPFGAGRRICPGITFAQANIEIALASLLYHFDWELPSGVKKGEIDMTEAFGVTVKRKAELLLHPIPRIVVTRVKEITAGNGVNVVYDSVGKDTYKASVECLASRGFLVSFGQSSGRPDPIPLSDLASKSLFVTRPSLLHYTATRDELLESAGEVFANVANGVLRVRVNHTYPLSEAARAHADLEGRMTSGSIVLIPDS